MEDRSDDPGDLDDRIADLEARVRDLQDELGRPPTVFGLPRPPTPREMLSFTGEYAIPTAIAVLKANVRALEALQGVIRLVDPERSPVDEERDRLEERAADASRATLDRLESALADVERLVRESDLPREGEARDILRDARRINREIRDRVERERRASGEARDADRDADPDRDDGGTTIELADDRGDDEDADGPDVDVEAELQSIKDGLDDPEGTDGDEDRDAEDDPDDGE